MWVGGKTHVNSAKSTRIQLKLQCNWQEFYFYRNMKNKIPCILIEWAIHLVLSLEHDIMQNQVVLHRTYILYYIGHKNGTNQLIQSINF